jgi:hypothetical protein
MLKIKIQLQFLCNWFSWNLILSCYSHLNTIQTVIILLSSELWELEPPTVKYNRQMKHMKWSTLTSGTKLTKPVVVVRKRFGSLSASESTSNSSSRRRQDRSVGDAKRRYFGVVLRCSKMFSSEKWKAFLKKAVQGDQ